jgi:transposase
MISAVIENCAGIDIGKKFIVVCVMKGAAAEEPQIEIRQYGMVVSELELLGEWLREQACTHVVMESTGTYWKPIFNILEDHFTLVLANPVEVKNRRGHKTDPRDSVWLAHLLRHGMVRSSFIPPRPVRELRDLTRRRTQLVRNSVQEKNRIVHTLEQGNVMIGNVLSDVFGLTGLSIVKALLEQKLDAQAMACLAKGKARQKIWELTSALEKHRMTDAQRSLIQHSLRHLEFLQDEILVIEQEIRQKLRMYGWLEKSELLQSLPGFQEISAASVLAELGPDMEHFPTAAQLSSWAGLCPGNNQSAGVQHSTHTTKGNRWLRHTLIEAAWAASKKKNSALTAFYRHIAAKRGKNRALVAVAHKLIILIYCLLTTGRPYQPSANEKLNAKLKARRIRYHVRCLTQLGIVVLPELGQSPPPLPSQ